MECLKCGIELDEAGGCPNGCTEDPDYEVMRGLDQDEIEVRIKSLASGACQSCGEKVGCAQGCYDSSLYDDGTESNTALEKGVCLVCGGPVHCPNECF